MSPAQQAANFANAQHSTGPRTVEGKAVSSQNAMKSGLFSTRDFIRPGEESVYAELCESVHCTLAPIGDLECTHADEIRRAMWRLRRCAETEAGMVEPCVMAVGGTAAPVPDPMQIEATAALQFSVDRARAQCHRLIHRCTAELRKLQTERLFRDENFPADTDLSYLGVAELRVINKGVDEAITGQMRSNKSDRIESQAAYDREAAEYMALPANFLEIMRANNEELVAKQAATKQTATIQTDAPDPISRNSRCACGSGLKHKRCCALKTAA